MSRNILNKRNSNNIITDDITISPNLKKQKLDDMKINLLYYFHKLFHMFKKEDRDINLSTNKRHTPRHIKRSKHVGYATVIYCLSHILFENNNSEEINSLCCTVYLNIKDILINGDDDDTKRFISIMQEMVRINNNKYIVRTIDYEFIANTLCYKFQRLTIYIQNISKECIFNVFEFTRGRLNFDMMLVPLYGEYLVPTKKKVDLTLKFDDDFYSIWNIFYTIRQLYMMHFIPHMFDFLSFKFTSDFSSVTITSNYHIIKNLLTTIPMILSIRHLDTPIHIGPISRKISMLFESKHKFDNWIAVRFISVLFESDVMRWCPDILKAMPDYDLHLKPLVRNLVKLMKRVHHLITIDNIHDYMTTLKTLADFGYVKQIMLNGMIRLIEKFNKAVDNQTATSNNKENIRMLQYIIEDILYPEKPIHSLFKRQTKQKCFTICDRILYHKKEISSDDRVLKWINNKNTVVEYWIEDRNKIITDKNNTITIPMSYESTREVDPSAIDIQEGYGDIMLLKLLTDESIFTDEDVLYILTNMYDKTTSGLCKFSKSMRNNKSVFNDLQAYHKKYKPKTDEVDVLSSHIALLLSYRYLYNTKKSSDKINDNMLRKTTMLMTESNDDNASNFFNHENIEYVLPLASSLPSNESSFIFNSVIGPKLGQLIIMIDEMDFLIPITGTISTNKYVDKNKRHRRQ
jgi:hypothetical protein